MCICFWCRWWCCWWRCFLACEGHLHAPVTDGSTSRREFIPYYNQGTTYTSIVGICSFCVNISWASWQTREYSYTCWHFRLWTCLYWCSPKWLIFWKRWAIFRSWVLRVMPLLFIVPPGPMDLFLCCIVFLCSFWLGESIYYSRLRLMSTVSLERPHYLCLYSTRFTYMV